MEWPGRSGSHQIPSGKNRSHSKKLTEIKASAHPLDSKLDSLQQAFTTGFPRGLIAEFYENKQHQGRPVFTRIDPIVDFNWGEKPPAPDVAKDAFPTTWAGFIKPLESGTYEFSPTMNNRGSIEFLQSNPNSIQGTYVDQFELTLEAGTFYPFALKHIEGWGKAKARFHWKLKSEGDDPIAPKEVLFHAPPKE